MQIISWKWHPENLVFFKDKIRLVSYVLILRLVSYVFNPGTIRISPYRCRSIHAVNFGRFQFAFRFMHEFSNELYESRSNSNTLSHCTLNTLSLCTWPWILDAGVLIVTLRDTSQAPVPSRIPPNDVTCVSRTITWWGSARISLSFSSRWAFPNTRICFMSTAAVAHSQTQGW